MKKIFLLFLFLIFFDASIFYIFVEMFGFLCNFFHSFYAYKVFSHPSIRSIFSCFFFARTSFVTHNYILEKGDGEYMYCYFCLLMSGQTSLIYHSTLSGSAGRQPQSVSQCRCSFSHYQCGSELKHTILPFDISTEERCLILTMRMSSFKLPCIL